MPSLTRVPPAVGQGLAIAGLAACLLGVALPHLRAASGAGARTELAESEAYLEAHFARINDLAPNHSQEVTNYRTPLADDLDIPELRRSAAASAGSDKRTATGPIVVFAGLALLALGCLTMVLSGASGHGVWALFLIIALVAGGVGLSHPEASAVPTIDGVPAREREPTETKRPEPTLSVSNRELCLHVMNIVLKQSGGSTKPTEDMIKSCIDSIGRKPPTVDQRRCLLRARSLDDLQKCDMD
jgi:hypothetical protein